MKKKFLILGSAFLATSITLAAAALVTPETASAADYNTTTVTTVATHEGASVRILAADDEYKGLRFGAYVNTEWYQDGYEAGFLLYEGEASALITHETVGAVECPSLVWQTATDYAVAGLDFYTAVIAGIDVSDNATVLTARAYVETAEGTYTYADTQVSSSVAEAASKAIASGKYTQYETELNGYLEGVSWTVTVNGATQLVAHGQKAVAPATPTMEGYTFAGWTANGKAFDFATDVITLDTTVEATWTAKTQTAFDFEEESTNDDMIYSMDNKIKRTWHSVSNEQAKSGNQSFKYANHQDSQWGLVNLAFTQEVLSQIDATRDGIRFSLYIDPNTCNATSYNVRVRDIAQSTEQTSGGTYAYFLVSEDAVETGKWLTYECYNSRVISKVVETGGIEFAIEHKYAAESTPIRTYNLYIDDIEIIKTQTTSIDFENAEYDLSWDVTRPATVAIGGVTINRYYGDSKWGVSNVAHSGSQSLAVTGTTNNNPCYKWYLNDEMIEALKEENVALRWYVYIQPNPDVPSTESPAYHLRATAATGFGNKNNVATNVWHEIYVSDATELANIVTNGYVVFYVESNFSSGFNKANYHATFFVDDIEVVKNYSVTEDFEGANVAVTSAGVTADTLTLTNGYGSGAFSLSSDAYSGSRAIARQIDATAVYTRLTFGTRMLAAINPENTMIRFRLKIVPNASEPNAGVATGAAGTTYAYYNLRFYKSAPAHSNSYGYYDTVTTNQWIEFFINDSASLTEIKSDGFISIITEVKNSQLSSNYGTLLIDDVKVLTGMGDGNETFTNDKSFDSNTYQVKVNTGTLSMFTTTAIGQESLLLENAQDQSYTTFVIKVPESAKTGTTKISLMLYINPHGCDATSYNVRVRGANAVEGSNQLTGHTGFLATPNTVATRSWLYYETTDATLIAAIVACDYLMINIEMVGNTSENYKVQIDNIRFENESEHTAASVDVAAEIASRVSENAKVSEIVVKNAAGETVALTDGKITAAGEYVITAKIVENGVTKTFTMKVIV